MASVLPMRSEIQKSLFGKYADAGVGVRETVMNVFTLVRK